MVIYITITQDHRQAFFLKNFLTAAPAVGSPAFARGFGAAGNHRYSLLPNKK
jgi:hypothetical protein